MFDRKDRLTMSIKVVEKGSMINTKTMVSKMTQDPDDNPYKRGVLNNVYKEPDKFPENVKLVYIQWTMLGMFNMTK